MVMHVWHAALLVTVDEGEQELTSSSVLSLFLTVAALKRG